MVHSFAKAVKKRKKQWRESVVHEVLFGDLLFTLDYLETTTLPFLIITLINILQIHQKTVNSCHVQSDRVTTDQQRPGATDFAAFPSVVALDHMECLGVLIQSQSEVLNFHVEVAAVGQFSSQVRSMPCPTARFLPMNVGSFTPFDLDGKYRLKVTEWRGMSILRSIAAMQITHCIEL